MLDLLGILFSSIMMFLVILRAIQMDNLQPWFKSPKAGPDDSGLKLRPENGGGDSRTGSGTVGGSHGGGSSASRVGGGPADAQAAAG